MTTEDPRDLHPDLTPERMAILAALLATVRRQALFDHDPGAGDGPWGLGCRSYERWRFEITNAAEIYDWLTIIEPHPAFQFKVGRVPMRFYSGPADAPHQRTLRQRYPELHEMQLLLADGELWGASERTLFRLAIEMDDEGDVAAVIVCKIDGEDADGVIVLGSCEIPIEESVTPMTMIKDAAAAVDLPPPPVGDLPEEDEHGIPSRAAGEDEDL